MKRLMLILTILICTSGIAAADSTIIEIKGSHFNPSNEDFRDIYGGGLMFGGEITVGIYKNLSFWLGLGHFHSKESNIIDEVTKNRLGLISKFGVNILVFKKLIADLFLDYTYCKVKPPEFGVNIGGISAGIGLGYKF